MNVKHAPLFDGAKVEAIYTEKDGVPVTYVCTTDLRNSDMPFDIFYRETPHPEFGNRYFGLGYTSGSSIMIIGADQIEDYHFGMIQDNDGEWWYSQSHHDCHMIDGKMIDGGRAYVRGNDFVMFKVKNGKFVTPVEANDILEMLKPPPSGPRPDFEKV
jgi:hypothetical protein